MHVKFKIEDFVTEPDNNVIKTMASTIALHIDNEICKQIHAPNCKLNEDEKEVLQSLLVQQIVRALLKRNADRNTPILWQCNNQKCDKIFNKE